MMNLANLLSEELISALGMTLLHSLWQGALAAVILGLLMLFMRRLSSQTRYRVGVGMLFLILSVFSNAISIASL